MRSMTGFGGSNVTLPNSKFGFTVELSSVNRKQLEVRPSLPQELASCEPMLRAMVGEKISRGAVNLRVGINGNENPLTHSKVNRTFLVELITQLRAIQAESGIGGEIEIQHLVALPGVIETSPPSAIPTEIENLLREAVGQALDNLIAMREAEGEILRQGFIARVTHLEGLTARLEPIVANLPDLMYEKLLTRLKNFGLELDFNDERVIKELVIFSDKADVSEELTRLKSHFVQFRNFLNSDEQHGRSMDFLMQEMFREINTLGNKAGCSATTPILVEFKSELEKIREQLQNIE